jgi:hypothetical protein
MKKVLGISVFALALSAGVSLKAQTVSVSIKNEDSNNLNWRYLDGKEVYASGSIGAGNHVSQNREAGLTLQVQCNGKWVTVGTVSSDRNKNKFTVSCD